MYGFEISVQNNRILRKIKSPLDDAHLFNSSVNINVVKNERMLAMSQVCLKDI